MRHTIEVQTRHGKVTIIGDQDVVRAVREDIEVQQRGVERADRHQTVEREDAMSDMEYRYVTVFSDGCSIASSDPRPAFAMHIASHAGMVRHDFDGKIRNPKTEDEIAPDRHGVMVWHGIRKDLPRSVDAFDLGAPALMYAWCLRNGFYDEARLILRKYGRPTPSSNYPPHPHREPACSPAVSEASEE